MPIKLLLADDHQIFRESLANLLNNDVVEVVGHAGSGIEAIEQARLYKPDVILMDIGMKDMDGIEATRRLLKESPDIRVVALTMHAQKNYIKEMLEAGASGYLLKNCSYTQLVEAINTTMNGGKYLSPEIAEIIVNDYVNLKNENHGSADITDREKEVLKLYAEGKTARMIGEKLFISVKTVGTHKQNVLKKLGLKTTADMMKYAIKHGIITIE
jgi:two-component system, NarL family, response regulator NreC